MAEPACAGAGLSAELQPGGDVVPALSSLLRGGDGRLYK